MKVTLYREELTPIIPAIEFYVLVDGEPLKVGITHTITHPAYHSFQFSFSEGYTSRFISN